MKLPLLSAVFCLLAGGLVAAAAGDLVLDPKIVSDTISLSASEGGEQILSIDAGKSFAGFRYIVAGSSSGVFPGTMMDSVRVPLNYDSYSEMMLTAIDRPGYGGCRGHLDATGKAQARLSMPAGQAPSLIGTIYYHAAVLIDPKTNRVVSTTNAVEVLLLP